jgi:hypothetical protein
LLVLQVQVEDDEGLQGVFAVQVAVEDSDHAAAEEEF